jgi:hypothetical protein
MSNFVPSFQKVQLVKQMNLESFANNGQEGLLEGKQDIFIFGNEIYS